MLDAFLLSLRLRITYRINGILYWLKRVPLLKKLLPGNIYDAGWLKSLALVLAVLAEFFTFFLGKAAYPEYQKRNHRNEDEKERLLQDSFIQQYHPKEKMFCFLHLPPRFPVILLFRSRKEPIRNRPVQSSTHRRLIRALSECFAVCCR